MDTKHTPAQRGMIEYDLADPHSIDRAQQVLTAARAAAVGGPPPSAQAVPQGGRREAIAAITTRLLRGYGDGRKAYVKLIAEASPEPAAYEDIRALFDSPKAIGGTHASLERSWKAHDGPGQFITTLPDGRQKMSPDLAKIVLQVLDELDRREGQG